MPFRFAIPLALTILAGAQAPEMKKKTLIIGIDGCRTDALLAARAPNMRALMRDGAFADNTRVLPDRRTGADTVSAAGWSSILTGVWADKHGVRNNYFEGTNYREFPHFFARLKKAQPSAFTASYSTWGPIHTRIVSAADDSQAMLHGKESYREGDARGERMAEKLLREGDPDVLFVHFDNVDETGHPKGFGPKVPAYMEAIEEVDGRIGRILDAMRRRTTYLNEDWLVVICTDHGGKGTGHAGGQKDPDVCQVFLIVTGRDVKRGKIEQPTFIVDVAVTVLMHMGVPIDPKWQLDGKPVGLRETQNASP